MATDLREAAVNAKRLLTGVAATGTGNISTNYRNFATACLNAIKPATPAADWLTVTMAKNAELGATGFTIITTITGWSGKQWLLLDGLGTMFYQMLFLAYTLPTSVLSTADKTILLTQFNAFYPDP